MERRIDLRLEEHHYNDIKAKAKLAGYTTCTAYVRDLALNNKITSKLDQDAIIRLKQHVGLLKHIIRENGYNSDINELKNLIISTIKDLEG